MPRSTIRLAVALAVAVFPSSPLSAQAPAAAPDSIYQVAQVEVRPEALNAEELGPALYARYPAPLRAAGVSGQVTVSMVVGSDGLPRGAEVVSSTDTLFNAPTLEVASMLRFSPAQMGGRLVPVRMMLPVSWEAGPVPDTPGPDSLGGYELSEVDVPPRPRNAADLQRALEQGYPPLLRDAGVGGTVQVRLLVKADGTVSHVRVTSSTHERFDAPTVAAIRTLRFTPGRVAGRPVAVWVELPIQWSTGRYRQDLEPVKDPPARRPQCVQATTREICY